ncbi:MAG: cbb3-type cytochrome oxidase assembly protein CcoS [Chlorobi bacterium]|jgi:cbb3-type cytochrome oxidase maturation protein|uniref:Cbb3-type cytochrome oxidase assembly protein CcoS n=1 Tax=Chryseobacterium indicum TaxID=2766954 RepID=A0ABS9C7H8_9FLAO|nr:cbb3-type cytochrome oxidase assembly protein CcoS [Chryseobacterium sp. PS-8]MCF2220525.1 cbb3-type cytochrome oxidase assembly protein CcoS [Chryseobacterium sp. PS-8]NPA10419.1 cbb3-type cytochrome oxidase assembly protein CcoS [Chlorobiota bacterium]
MDILYLMILCSVSLAAVFLVVFIVYARKGQFEDDESPAVRILFDSDEIKEKEESGNKEGDDEKGEKKN